MNKIYEARIKTTDCEGRGTYYSIRGRYNTIEETKACLDRYEADERHIHYAYLGGFIVELKMGECGFEPGTLIGGYYEDGDSIVGYSDYWKVREERDRKNREEWEVRLEEIRKEEEERAKVSAANRKARLDSWGVTEEEVRYRDLAKQVDKGYDLPYNREEQRFYTKEDSEELWRRAGGKERWATINLRVMKKNA